MLLEGKCVPGFYERNNLYIYIYMYVYVVCVYVCVCIHKQIHIQTGIGIYVMKLVYAIVEAK